MTMTLAIKPDGQPHLYERPIMTERLVDWPRYTRWTWIIAILLILLLLILWLSGRGPGSAALCCSAAPAAVPAAPVVAPAAKTVGPLKFAADNGKITLEGSVPSEDAKKQLVQEATHVYGAGNVMDKLTVDQNAAAPAWLAQAGTLLNWLKPGKPLTASGDASYMTLTGVVPSDTDKAERGKWAREFFGNTVTVNNELTVQAPAAPAAPVAKAEDVQCGASITAAVQFATGSATLTEEGKSLLDAIAPCLKDGKYEVSGHTDNVGAAALNIKLSKARADAARAYLLLRGVDAEAMIAKGYGPSKPIADNSSAEGRAKNRRIEFAKQ
jgi:OmpA-OmpF porin, OOP family